MLIGTVQIAEQNIKHYTKEQFKKLLQGCGVDLEKAWIEFCKAVDRSPVETPKQESKPTKGKSKKFKFNRGRSED